MFYFLSGVSFLDRSFVKSVQAFPLKNTAAHTAIKAIMTKNISIKTPPVRRLYLDKELPSVDIHS